MKSGANGTRNPLAELIDAQRNALLASGPEAARRLEAANEALAAGLANALDAQRLPGYRPFPAAQTDMMRRALADNRIALNRLNAFNDRALRALMGEPETTLYRRQG